VPDHRPRVPKRATTPRSLGSWQASVFTVLLAFSTLVRSAAGSGGYGVRDLTQYGLSEKEKQALWERFATSLRLD